MKSNLDFKNGLVFQNKTQFYFTPINHFLLIINEIIENYNSKTAKKILKESSKIDSEIIYQRIYRKSKSEIQTIKEFIEIINSFGIGKIKLKNNSKEKIIFIQNNSPLINAYQKIFSKKPKVFIEEIICGYIENFMKIVLKKQIICEIKFDIKKQIFSYTIKKNKKSIKILISNKKYPIQPPSKNNISNLLKKLIINRKIINNNGLIKVVNMYGVLIPYFFLIEIFSQMKTKKLKDNLINIGLMQGKNSVEMHKKLFGNKDPLKIFNQVVKMADISGMGNIKIINNNPFEFKIESNLFEYYSKFYSKETLNSFQLHFNSICIGVVEFSFNKTTKHLLKEDINQLKIIKNHRELNTKEKEILKLLNQKSLILNIPSNQSNI